MDVNFHGNKKKPALPTTVSGTLQLFQRVGDEF